MWKTASSFGTRPSELLGIEATPETALLRFEIDSAVGGLGRYVDDKLGALKEDGTRVYKSVKAVLDTARSFKPEIVTSAATEQKPVHKYPPVTFKRRARKT